MLECGKRTRRSHLKVVSVSLCMGWIFQSHTLQKVSIYSEYIYIKNEVATLVWVPSPHNLGSFPLIRTQVMGSQKTGEGRGDACGF